MSKNVIPAEAGIHKINMFGLPGHPRESGGGQ